MIGRHDVSCDIGSSSVLVAQKSSFLYHIVVFAYSMIPYGIIKSNIEKDPALPGKIHRVNFLYHSKGFDVKCVLGTVCRITV